MHIESDADETAERAFNNLTKSIAFFELNFEPLPWPEVECAIRWGTHNANALWVNDMRRVVLGDGDSNHAPYGNSISVVMHELSHGIVHATSLGNDNLTLTVEEHFCDVFGMMAEQWDRGLTSEYWLLGAATRICGTQNCSIRNLLDPTDAAAKYKGAHTWAEASVSSSNVYFNMGVLNRVFALSAEKTGGFSWETLGPVWLEALKSIKWQSSIPDFRNRVIAASADYQVKVKDAFRIVGLL